ncbi:MULTISPECIES: twin-arginine translocase subunit TatC [Microbacterium]|uniref:Sec-independent protein translocase protein TatC n=2 Tax=Microbacterium maritypicum TaxID=33918 RepID=A0A4Y4B5M5_MICMQ|nr:MULTISPECIES: twin-arginine translocase subunit TatC [Microbacterium]AZS47216.1 Sec-independent protein translocase protein TatC [Microbacterium oxydans]EYT59253.1 preprotein translocase subunit TatC [Microbacterium sp. UCD-TDU]KQV04331.1 preprotein translocase subunit TatC [Microbacterium sp. Root322]KQY76746.1 preprotein translocase subunit TatC [Microbacterium sp. Root1433D1]MBP5802473.1 twin-arginine translocase subunit TatC [Microbacterium liquefaciens]
MSLGAHLVELRKRLMFAALALVVGMVIAFLVADPIINFITEPVRIIAEKRGDDFSALNFGTITSAFDMRMRIAFSIGIFLSAPVWLWQVWAFIMPGLTRKEVRYTIGFVVAAVPLFFAGCYLGVMIMPHIIELMWSFTPAGATNLYSAQEYYDFIFKLMIVIGISFVLPVFLVALNLAGVMSGRAILKGWRVAIIIATVFAALATPAADVVSMLMLAGILIVLFFAAAGLSLIFDRRKRKRDEASGLLPDPA